MLNLFQHLSGQVYERHVGYLANGIPKQVRDDLLLYYTLLILKSYKLM